MYMYIYTSVCLYICIFFFPIYCIILQLAFFKLGRSYKSFHVKTQRSVGLAKKVSQVFLSDEVWGKIQANFLANQYYIL